MKKSVIEIFEKTGDIPKWKPVIGASVDVFSDPITQHIHEGVAKIVKIHVKKDGILDCDVKFKNEDEVVRRQIKYIS